MKRSVTFIILMFAANLGCVQGVFAAQNGPNVSVVQVNGLAYLDLETFSRASGLRYAWDGIVKNVTVSGSNGEVIFHIGSEYILSQNKLVKLTDRTRFFQGSVVAPFAAKNFLEAITRIPAASTHPSGATNAPRLSRTEIPPLALPSHQLRRVVVDAGHGGRDFGAVNGNGVREKELALWVAAKVREGLKAQGIQVIMTRGADYFIPLAERSRIANKKGADLFVSIHANASQTKTLKGFEVYYLSEATDDEALAIERAENSALKFDFGQAEAPAKDLRTIVWDLKEGENRRESIRLAECVAEHAGEAAHVFERRIRSANFHVLKWAECPAILIEIGYLTNHEDAGKLTDLGYCQKLADGIVQGITDYKEEFERTDAFTR